MPTLKYWEIEQRLSLPFEAKVAWAINSIRAWYRHWHGQVYVAYSGGKDSTVLLHLVRSCYPDVPASFNDTGLEFPEIRKFVRATPNVVIQKPKMPFREVIAHYGYPCVSKETSQKIHECQHTKKGSNLWRLRTEGITKAGDFKPRLAIPKKHLYLIGAPFKVSHKCCEALKKRPAHAYEKATGLMPYLGVTLGESRLRRTAYALYGCNAFETRNPRSKPLSLFSDEDIWEYIRTRKLAYSPIYDMGYARTGCIFCMFGVHLEKAPNRFQRLAVTHPKLWRYCLDELGLRKVLAYMSVPYEPDKQGTLF